jgi:nickel-type superoxide dismutase maturation protease
MAFREGCINVTRRWYEALRWSIIWVPPLIAFSDNVASIKIVSGQSMSPTLNPEMHSSLLDVVLISKISEYKTGDIVLLSDPLREESTRIVKRISEITQDGSLIYVQGDNPNHSTDSRHFGYVPSVMVEGVVKAIIFPPWRAGYIPAPALE